MQDTAELRWLSQGAGLVPELFSELMGKSRNPPHSLFLLTNYLNINPAHWPVPSGGTFRNPLMLLDRSLVLVTGCGCSLGKNLAALSSVWWVIVVLAWAAPGGRQLAFITSRASNLKFRQTSPRKHSSLLLVPAPIKESIPIPQTAAEIDSK